MGLSSEKQRRKRRYERLNKGMLLTYSVEVPLSG